MTAISLRGYWRTLSARIDCSPAIRMTRLTTIARTGRLMNKSVNRISAVLRLGRPAVRWLHLVVDLHGGAVAQLEDARRDDLLAGLDAAQHRNLIAAGAAKLDDLLTHSAIGPAFLALQVGDDEHGIAAGRVADRRRPQRYDRRRRPEQHLRLHEHARTQLARRVGERGLHGDVAGRLIDDRVDRGDPAGELEAAEFGGGNTHAASGADLSGILLRNAEVDVDRIERLQRHDRAPAGQVLTQVDGPDAEHARERCADRLAGDGGADLANLRLGLLLRRGGGIELGARDRVVLDQALHPFERQP